MDPERAGLSTGDVLRVLRRGTPWIVLCAVLVAGVAYGISKQKTKEYTATAAILFNYNPLSQQIAGLSSGGGSSSLLAQQDSNLELVKLGDTAVKTAARLGHGLTEEEVSGSLSISARAESNVITVSATSISPALAAAIANTYVGLFVKQQQASNRQFFKSALALVNRQLARLSPVQRFGSDGLDLEDRAHTLTLLAELGYDSAELAQEALVPSSPSGPRTKRNTILGGILGLLLGIAVAFLLERLDRRLRGAEDLEGIYRLPVLGFVPKSSALARSARDSGIGKPLPAADAEAFSLIRAHLRFFNVDRDLRALVIASPAPGDGKTTVARHLADAAARSGSRVLLLEVDMRHPTLARHFNLQPGPGLAGVLIGAVSMDEAIRTVAVSASPGEGASGRTLDVLTAGAVLPPNPGELLEGRAMDVLLARAKSIYDLVVLDTPPLTVVSDAFPLLPKVDGVVIVGWLGRSRRDSAEQLQHVLAASGVPTLGIIVNGAKSKAAGSYAEPSSDNASTSGDLASRESSTEDFVATPNS